MTDRILEILRASGADAWELTETEEHGWEFYFIRKKLDQNRAKTVKTWLVKVYRLFDEGKFLGSAAATINEGSSDEEIRAVVGSLCEEAMYVRNPAYTLAGPAAAEGGAQTAAADVKAISSDFIRTMGSLPETDSEDINSCEIFVSNIKRRFLNSEGIDVTCEYPSSMLEVVSNARRDGREIELYRLYNSGGCDPKQLSEDVGELLRFGKDKLIAVPTPSVGKYDVVFSTDASREIYGWFADKMSSGAVVRGISDWKPGDQIVPYTDGDRITLRALKYLPNSSGNAAYDREGAPVRDLTLIENGVAASYFGSRQFSQYLGLDDSFIASNFEVEGGSGSAAELRRGNFLEVVEFSSFQVDTLNGDLAGEIRLGYLHRDGNVIPVSGGSVSGSLSELAGAMKFSKERRQFDSMLLPSVTRIKGVTVTGAE